jgi:hypothetical protein
MQIQSRRRLEINRRSKPAYGRDNSLVEIIVRLESGLHHRCA